MHVYLWKQWPLHRPWSGKFRATSHHGVHARLLRRNDWSYAHNIWQRHTQKCQCKSGWEGPDCTKPVCQSSCGQRELCVAPDTCDCIPGYHGEGCLEATCAQSCLNGYCLAPDVCTCDPGWFDTNCVSSNDSYLIPCSFVLMLYQIFHISFCLQTTPVCEQTCGNGGKHAVSKRVMILFKSITHHYTTN